MAWDSSPDPDFSRFLIYRTLDSEGAPPLEIDPYGTTIGTTWSDVIEQGENAWVFRYWLVTEDLSGNRSTVTGQPGSPTEVLSLPRRTALHAAVPNPFNPRTKISFDLIRTVKVDLGVFDIRGRRVKTLILAEVRQPGRHDVYWTGQDDSGRDVAAGVYFYKLNAGAFNEMKRMTLLK